MEVNIKALENNLMDIIIFSEIKCYCHLNKKQHAPTPIL